MTLPHFSPKYVTNTSGGVIHIEKCTYCKCDIAIIYYDTVDKFDKISKHKDECLVKFREKRLSKLLS